MDLALNNLQRLICHKTQPNNQPTYQPLRHWHSVTQGQFLNGVKFVFRVLILFDYLPKQEKNLP